jgi:hypothetical protein
MTVSRFQYQRLKVYERYHRSNSYLASYLRAAWLPWLLLIVCGLAFSWLLPSTLAGFAVGVCVGSFFRDLRYLQDGTRLWPITRQIFNWQKISELIEAHEKNTA